jgi:hypothetical protein
MLNRAQDCFVALTEAPPWRDFRIVTAFKSFVLIEQVLVSRDR